MEALSEVGVCIDMKKAWRLELMRQLPHAKVVVDRFHGIQDANRRVEEARKVEKEVTRRPIPRWPLLKNQEELTPRQAQELRWIYENHANVRHFHAVKEELRAVYEAKDRQEAAALLDRIIFNTQDASDVAMVQWGRTLKEWREAILAFHDLRITNAFTEGTPTKIKLLKRLSYGFRNAETYIRKMLLGLLPWFLLELTPHLLA
ncbi:MAG: transposase [Clostridiales bacterium]|nr:transposase [Clostridiales bacterium]